MKRISPKVESQKGIAMRAQYDFTDGMRGKHYRALEAGYTITIHQSDGTTIVQEVRPKAGAVVLAPDVRQYFSDSESVNAALRSLIRLIPQQRKPAAKRAQDAKPKRRTFSGNRPNSRGKKA